MRGPLKKEKMLLSKIIAAAVCIHLMLAAQPGAGAEPAGAEILTQQSYWRWYVMLRPPVMPGRDGGKPELLAVARGLRTSTRVDHLETAPPPAGWEQADFEDAAWPRSRAAWLRELAFGRYSSSLACLRGKFHVADPKAAAGLTLTLRFRGGVAVYLNGTEVARSHLPEGSLRPETAALPYTKDAYVDAKGNIIPDYWGRRRLPEDVRKDMEGRIARRERTLGPVKLPARLVRKGVNVLAIEVRRSEYHPLARTWFTNANLGKRAYWVPADLSRISLRAAGGATPNVARPKGIQVWNHDRNDRVTALDYGDPNEPLRPVRIVAARNGSFCGQFVVSGTQPLKGVVVRPLDLKAADGAVIPATAVTVLYGRMDWGAGKFPAWCDGLMPKPPAQVPVRNTGGAVLPVLVRVHVPKDAAPGEYRGELAVSAAGWKQHLVVPVQLYVADWTVPAPRNYRTYMGIYQSPTSLALQYKVPEWSEKHWALMDRSFALLARVGNKFANITLVEQTQFGNDQGMVHWIRTPGGGWDYDFSVLDRYLQLVKKHFGPVDYLPVQVWHAGGWSHRGANQKNTVTVVDKKTGKRESLQVPAFDSKAAQAFWKPVLKGIHDRLAKVGMEKAMCLGILSDSTAPSQVFTMFDAVWPGGGRAKWMRGCHSTSKSPDVYRADRGGGTVILHEHCYGMSMVSPRVKTLPGLWNYRGKPGTAYFRVAGHETVISLVGYRSMAERGLWVGKQGIGRICLDFWPVVPQARSRHKAHLYNRYPHSSCAQRKPTLMKLTWPGPDGAETSVRYEALCEGVQESEAMIVVSEALSRHADKLGAQLAAKCRTLLRERLWYCHTRNQARWQQVYFHMNHHGWQDLSKRLLDCAAEVARATAR